MSGCNRYQEMIENYLAGEISSGDRVELDEHCQDCPECAGMLELHQSLLILGSEIPLPEKTEMREMREAVMQVAGETPKAPGSNRPPSGFLVDLRHFWRAHPLPSGLATAAVLAMMVFLGFRNPQNQSFENELLRQSTQRTAAHRVDLDEYWDSPFSYANVSVRNQGQGQLALSFEASRHVEMQVPQDSPLAREVLLHAIMEPSSMGSRLKAMEVTPEIRDGLLKEALVTTLLNDPDPAVRVNALAVLARYPFDQSSQDAYIQTLSQDQDVQIRLNALEELARQNVNRDIIRTAVGKNESAQTMTFLQEAMLEF